MVLGKKGLGIEYLKVSYRFCIKVVKRGGYCECWYCLLCLVGGHQGEL